MINLLEEQLKAHHENKIYALVTIVKTQGATPRNVGSKMMVFNDGTFIGTIGGGVMEKQVIADAIQSLKNRETGLHNYDNRAVEDGSVCGGTITVYIEAAEAVPKLVVIGAGHVGGALIKLASMLKYNITAIDTRDSDMVLENVKDAASFVHVENFHVGIKSLNLGAGAYYLVSTYGHSEDGEALAAVLEQDAAYIGMMGSPAKINTIFNKLRDQGFSDEKISSIYAPVGLDIGGENPMEIAFSIMSEMQMVRYKKSGQSLKNILNR